MVSAPDRWGATHGTREDGYAARERPASLEHVEAARPCPLAPRIAAAGANPPLVAWGHVASPSLSHPFSPNQQGQQRALSHFLEPCTEFSGPRVVTHPLVLLHPDPILRIQFFTFFPLSHLHLDPVIQGRRGGRKSDKH